MIETTGSHTEGAPSTQNPEPRTNMPNSIITLENITKAYDLYDHPLDRVKEVFHPFRKKYSHPFYALKDITFGIDRGESVGIIGRNGSGKSTLLKIIAGIIAQTRGKLIVEGKVAALLELGTGFNPEFTGRENIFLNGALLGLSREALNENYDDIVAFSGIGDFISQPVKQYSSGMVVRLAFAVATHVWADTLIIDEALAVGDEAFQRKCFALLQDHKQRGNTLIFVSHSANAVVELCDRALLLDEGRLLIDDAPKIAVREYHKRLFSPVNGENVPEEGNGRDDLAETTADDSAPFSGKAVNSADDTARCYWEPALISQSTVPYAPQGACIRAPAIRNAEGQKVNTLYPGEICFYTYEAEFLEDASQVVFGSMIKTTSGLELGGMITHPLTAPMPHIAQGAVVTVRFAFACRLMPGVYFFNAGITGYKDGTQTYLHRVIDAVMFRVQAIDGRLCTGTVDFLEEPLPSVTFRSAAAAVGE